MRKMMKVTRVVSDKYIYVKISLYIFFLLFEALCARYFMFSFECFIGFQF